MDEVTYSPYPERAKGGQYAGPGPAGVRAEHPSGIVVCVCVHRSPFKNKKLADELIEYALSDI